MKIFMLGAGSKYNCFELPEKVEDSLLIPYKIDNESVEHVITIEAENGEWILKSNGSVNIIEGEMTVPQKKLVAYSFYHLKVLGYDKEVLLYASPLIDTETYKLSFNDLNVLTIGRNDTCNIQYLEEYVDDISLQLSLSDGNWIVHNEKSHSIYLNSVLITKDEILKLGDIIFIMGLKIVWMGSFIKINNPNRKVKVQGFAIYAESEDYNNTVYSEVKDEDAYVDLYKEEDYFYHTPRLKNLLVEENIKIDAPPQKEKTEDLPAILSIGSSITMGASSLMMGYSVVQGLTSGTKTLSSSLPSIVMCLSMVIGSLILPKISSNYQKKQSKKREKLRQRKYTEYLGKQVEQIETIIKSQEQALNDTSPSVLDCKEMILNKKIKNANFWSREVTDNYFLLVRLGIGRMPSKINIDAPQEHFSLDEDNLFENVYQTVEASKYLNNIPITYSFVENKITGLFFNCSYKNAYVDSLILQLVALQSANDLKIIILTTEDRADRWDYLKYLPHNWSLDKQVRLFAANSNDINEVSNYLADEYNKRKEQITSNKDKTELKNVPYKAFGTYYLIINDNYKVIKNLNLIDNLFKDKENFGFSLICIEDKLRDLPKECEKFIEIAEKQGSVLGTEINSQNHQKFKNEFDQTLDMRKIGEVLSNIPIASDSLNNILPNSLSFLQMYNVSKIDHLNILNRWKNNNPVLNLATPIGVHTNGEQFILDLHEKFHGPHGLIAGSTGSGKSEFILTYILSMAVNYHPYEVQFVLIDYKGGGLAGAFENKETGVKLPHLIGTITNLDTSEMNRTLVSIESELKRRQKKFNEVREQLGTGTIDIYKYQKLYREGLVKEPMAHLFIISDEFAELKSQQPEFMQQLISTARIGRSLGMHLILATQKPTGVVNDQIWSNSKFKVCLKVQDRSDSMEMLKRPEAASIKEVGRFYLQVGYDDYFDIGQSGWAGEKYVPTDVIIKKEDDSINFINNVGYVTKSINNEVKKEVVEDNGDQLTNIVKYISDLGKKEDIHTTKLWLDAIPKEIFVENLKKKYQYHPTPYLVTPVIGEFDQPNAQKQGLLNVDLTKKGGLLIYGQPNSGKENLLSTIIWSISLEHSPDEVSIYVLDFGAETLKMFHKFPHVGEVITIDENDKIVDLFALVEEELEHRKELFSDFGGSYVTYIENSGNKLPLMVIILNNYEAFSETYPKYVDGIQPFLRDGSKYGIDFIVTTATTNSIRSRTAQNFNTKISLQLPNESDYRSVLNAPRGLFPAKYFGRGLIQRDDEVFEFQTAYIYEQKNINNVVRTVSEQLNKAYTTRTKKLKRVPNIVSVDAVLDNISTLENVPVGYDINTKDVVGFNLLGTKFVPLLANDISEYVSFIKAFSEIISRITDVNLKVIDCISILKQPIPNVKCFNNNFEQLLVMINNEMVQSKQNGLKNVYIFIGISSLKDKLSVPAKQLFDRIFNEKSENTIFIFADHYTSYRKLQLESWYQNNIDNNTGIWLGAGIGGQMILNVNNLSIDDRNLSYPYMALVINNGNYKFIKHVVDMEEENEK